ncbi:MAG: DUF3145 domain-containing protein [Actinobacteria bacterium]|nr:DUF3145 domain-containing protein [Actinomycetota bacterium]
MTVVVTAQEASPARGVLFVHSVPRALCPHVEWALATVFAVTVSIDWAPQPIASGAMRAEILWSGPAGTGARIASTLLAFHQARFEVTEDPAGDREGERFVATPALGLFRATIGVHGDVMVHEDRLRSLLGRSGVRGESLADEVRRLIGEQWDDELEPFRVAHSDSTVRLLHEVV